MADDDWNVELDYGSRRARWRFIRAIPASVKVLMYSTCASIVALSGFCLSAVAWGSDTQTEFFAYPLQIRAPFRRSVVYVPRWAEQVFDFGFVLTLIVFALLGASIWLHRAELKRVQ